MTRQFWRICTDVYAILRFVNDCHQAGQWKQATIKVEGEYGNKDDWHLALISLTAVY